MRTKVGLFVGLNTLDYLLTAIALSYGAMELNPVMRALTSEGWLFAIIKVGILPLLVVALLPRLRRQGRGIATALVIGMGLVVVWNIIGLASWRLL